MTTLTVTKWGARRTATGHARVTPPVPQTAQQVISSSGAIQQSIKFKPP